jgi:hypothetical protein
MSDKDHGLLEFPLKRFELALDFAPSNRIQRTKWFIKQDDRRVSGQRARDADPLALSTGEFAGKSLGESIGVQTD